MIKPSSSDASVAAYRVAYSLDEDAQDEVLASIEQGLPPYLSRDEQRRVAVAVLDSLRRNLIHTHPDWATGNAPSGVSE